MRRFLSAKEQKKWPGPRWGLRTVARKANEFGFRTQTGAAERAEKATRAPVRFALACPQSQWIRFSSANPMPQKMKKENANRSVAFSFSFFIFPGGSALFPGGSALFHLNLADLHGIQCISVLLRGDAGTAFFQDPDWGFREGCFENHGVGNHTDIRAQTY